MPDVSIVAPAYNESEGIDEFLQRVTSVMDRLDVTYEIVLVNDGSRDDTLQRLLEHCKRMPQLKVVDLTRNFGKDIALTAAIEHATGRAVIPMDADLQDPPELVGELIAGWRQGYDVVYATRRRRVGESWPKRVTASLFYKAFRRATRLPMPENTGDFRLMDRRVVDALARLPERNRFMKGLFAWLGFRCLAVLYDRQPRHAGTTKWNYWRLWNFALDGITSFTSLPLRVWSYVGIAIALPSMVYAIFLVVRTIVQGRDVPGYASIMVAVLLLGGLQLVTLGIIGEYLGRVFLEVKGRPLYLVRETYGFEGARPTAAQPPAPAAAHDSGGTSKRNSSTPGRR